MNRVVPYQSQRNISNKMKNNTMNNNFVDNNTQNIQKPNTNANINPNPISSPTVNPSSSFLKAFLTSKKGIILLSVIGTVVIASVVVAVVVTQVSKDKKKEENNDTLDINPENSEISNIQPTEHILHYYGDQKDEIFEDEDDELEDENNNNYEDTEKYKSDIRNDKKFISPLSSLSKSNLVEFEISVGQTRNVPTQTEIENEELINYIPSYNGDNSQSNQKYDEILEENKKLVASATTYDEIDENGNLFLNGESTGKKLYKHKFSENLYGGNIADSELSVIKKIKINPISPTNYITGLYAPPGEVIKIEFSNNDLENIGNSIEFIIGQVTQDGGGSENSKRVGLKRVPILYSKLIIKKNPGYIGSFIGGPIYISNPTKRKIFTVTISNAIPYKHLIYGITTKEEFEQMDSYSAPFFELDVRESIRYSGPIEVVQGLNYENLVQNLIFWDKCARTSRKIPGGSGTIKGIHFLFDPCVNTPGAYALAYVGAYWCQVPLNFNLALDYVTITKYGAWGHIHELNHHYQKFGFSSQVLNEVTNNVVNLVEYILYSQISGLRNEFSEAAITTVSGNHRNLNPEFCLNDLVQKPPNSNNELRFYEPILQAFGYDLFIKVTQYGNGSGGVDLFYRSLTEVLHYDFTYYVEKILNLAISESVITECQSHGYHIFIPVSCIYQTGRYFNYESHQHFSNTSLPYRIPRGGPSKLDFEKHIIVPSGFIYEIKEITQPHYGHLEKISDLIYTYTPDEHEDLSGIIKLTIHVQNLEEEISTNVKLGLNFQVDNTQSVQTNYLYDNIIYDTTIYDAIDKNFEGYSSIEFFPNFAGSMTGIKEGNIGVWEGKFRIDDEGYNYILYKGGRGPSVLYAKINDETEYRKIGEILINQSTYMFGGTSLAYYEINLNKGDIVYFKVYLLGKTLSNGATGWINIGISKDNDVSHVKTLGKNDIVGTNAEFDQPYVFHSGDPYKTDNIFDSYSFFDYTLIEVSSPNFESWDNLEQFNLLKMIDNNENTYMHTGRNFRISNTNPLIINFDLGKLYYFDHIIFTRGPIKAFYVPKIFNISISEDGVNWNEEGEFTAERNGDNHAELNIGKKLYTRYIRLDITKQFEGYYVAFAKIDFIEKSLKLYQKTPEFVDFEGENIEINFENFPYFGHSYILQPNCAISFLIKETTGIRIKVCNKYDSNVDLIINNDRDNKKNFQINANDDLDFPIEIRGLPKDMYRFKIEVNEGKLDFEYILYET